MKQDVTLFTLYPFKIGQKIRINGSKRNDNLACERKKDESYSGDGDDR